MSRCCPHRKNLDESTVSLLGRYYDTVYTVVDYDTVYPVGDSYPVGDYYTVRDYYTVLSCR